MNFTAAITSVENMLRKVYLSHNLFTDFALKFYQNQEVYFSYFFRKYIEKTVLNINYPV